MLERCIVCKSAWLHGGPASQQGRADLHETGAYAIAGGGSDRFVKPFRRLSHWDRLRLIGKLKPGARIVEVGAGRGDLVAALRARGHDAVGIEPSRALSRQARARDLPVDAVALEQATYPAGEADLVVAWHVLEHLDDPEDAVRRFKGWLKPDGRLVVAVPNLDSLQARIGRDRWFHQDVPRHRTQFTAEGVSELIRRSGLDPVRVRHLMLDQNALGMWLTLLNLLTVGRDVPFRFLKRDLVYPRRADATRDALVTAVAALPLVPVAALLELVGGSTGRGGSVVVHAALT